VTLHQSSFGFIEVNPTKPRVLTAGAYFIAALAIPILMASVMIRSDGIDKIKVMSANVLVSVLSYYFALPSRGNRHACAAQRKTRRI
jgi:hypothetical protein